MSQVFVWTVGDVLYLTVGGLLVGAWLLVSWDEYVAELDVAINAAMQGKT